MGIDKYGAHIIAPKLSKWKLRVINGVLNALPFLYIKRTNKILKQYNHLVGGEFIQKVNEELGVKVTFSGSTDVDYDGPLTIVANHPGGADVLATIETLWRFREKFKILANKLICVTPVENLVIPVDTMKKKNKVDFNEIHKAYQEGNAVVFFAAGLNSRFNENGELRDREWRSTFLDYAFQYKTPIICLHIETINSKLFYRVANIRKKFSFLKKVPLENIFQLREFHIEKEPVHITISPIITYEFWSQLYSETSFKENRQLAKYLYNWTYDLPTNYSKFKEWIQENGLAQTQ